MPTARPILGRADADADPGTVAYLVDLIKGVDNIDARAHSAKTRQIESMAGSYIDLPVVG